MLEIGEGIILENNKEYVIIDIIDYNNKKYLILSNVDDLKDVVVRIYDNDSIKGLSSREELNKVIEIYVNRIK